MVQQANSREWLGTWGAPGNGEGWADLVRAGVCIGDYMDHHSLHRSTAVVRLDGLYGHIPPDTGTLRELFDVPAIRRHAADHSPIITRMIVARTHRKTDEPFRIGRRSPEWTDELFVTSLSPEGWSATDILDL